MHVFFNGSGSAPSTADGSSLNVVLTPREPRPSYVLRRRASNIATRGRPNISTLAGSGMAVVGAIEPTWKSRMSSPCAVIPNTCWNRVGEAEELGGRLACGRGQRGQRTTVDCIEKLSPALYVPSSNPIAVAPDRSQCFHGIKSIEVL